jgi:hypothetical protein
MAVHGLASHVVDDGCRYYSSDAELMRLFRSVNGLILPVSDMSHVLNGDKSRCRHYSTMAEFFSSLTCSSSSCLLEFQSELALSLDWNGSAAQQCTDPRQQSRKRFSPKEHI